MNLSAKHHRCFVFSVSRGNEHLDKIICLYHHIFLNDILNHIIQVFLKVVPVDTLFDVVERSSISDAVLWFIESGMIRQRCKGLL